jgi:hypothetical protein
MAERFFDFDGTFFRGCNSSMDPGQVQLGAYWLSINMINQGGILSCRPGHRCIVTLPEGNLQGGAYFRPKVGLEHLVIVIDGLAYASEFPFDTWRTLPNILLSPEAKQVFFVRAEQSANRLNDDLESPIEVITPRNILFIQDGGFSAPAWYDGSNSGQDRGKLYGIPSGSVSRWVGDRLWVATGSNVYASDIANPFSFREQIYLGGVSAFVFPSEVTGMAITPSLEFPQLLVFTENTTSIIKASVRERASWVSTSDMQRQIFDIGCSSAKSVIEHFGQLAWFSSSGIVFFDSAALSKQTARLPLRDTELLYSKTQLHSDLSLVAGAGFGPYILISVPAEDLFNRHTWVANNASLETLQDSSGPSWSGYWTGTRPVEWIHGVIAGSDRIYHVSHDEDGSNRLWESFTKDQLDSGCPIQWAVFTRGYFGMTSQSGKPPGLECRFCWADVSLAGIREDFDMSVYFSGGLRGAFKRILAQSYKIAKGSISSGLEIDMSTEIFALKPQSRKVRTEDARQLVDSRDTGACPVESDFVDCDDESFQLLIVGQGPATIRWIRAFAQPGMEIQSADSDALTDETGVNAVRFDGFGVHADDITGAEAALSAIPLQEYSANATVTLTYSTSSITETATGIGHATSVISDAAANRMATRIAERMAEQELQEVVPDILSAGEGF